MMRYYQLIEPFTSLTVVYQGDKSCSLSVWANGAFSGTLKLRTDTDEFSTALRAFFEDQPIVETRPTVNDYDVPAIILYDVPATDILISEQGALCSYRDICSALHAEPGEADGD